VAPIAPRTFLKAALMFAASGGTTSSEFIIFPHSPTPTQKSPVPRWPLNWVISGTTLGRFGGEGVDTEPAPTPRVRLGHAHKHLPNNDGRSVGNCRMSHLPPPTACGIFCDGAADPHAAAVKASNAELGGVQDPIDGSTADLEGPRNPRISEPLRDLKSRTHLASVEAGRPL
jgi:hypothetical protein